MEQFTIVSAKKAFPRSSGVPGGIYNIVMITGIVVWSFCLRRHWMFDSEFGLGQIGRNGLYCLYMRTRSNYSRLEAMFMIFNSQVRFV